MLPDFINKFDHC